MQTSHETSHLFGRCARFALAAAVALSPLACATPNAAGGSGGDTASGQTSLLGKAESFASTALTAAKSALSGKPDPAPADKQEAAQAGVAAAKQQAQSQGSPFSQLEEQALLNYVKSKL
jgi:hypothetical protein